MTSWSLKNKTKQQKNTHKKIQQEILNVSHAFVLVFSKDFGNWLKKEKAQIPDVDRNNHRKSTYWELTQQRKKASKLQIFTRYKVFMINPKNKTQKLKRETTTYWPCCFSFTWESWVLSFGGRKVLHWRTLQKSQMFVSIRCFRSHIHGLIPCSHLEFTDSWRMH